MSVSPDWFYGSDYMFAVLCAAFALEFIFGGLPGLSQILSLPRTISAAVACRAGRRLNRQNRSSRSRRMRGALVVLVLVPLAGIGGLYGAEFCRSLADGWILEAGLVAMCVGLQRPLVNAGALRRALARKSLDRARSILGRAVGYETDAIDEHGLARGSVEMFAVRLCDGLVGPVFWYVIGGLPGLFAYRVTAALPPASRRGKAGRTEPSPARWDCPCRVRAAMTARSRRAHGSAMAAPAPIRRISRVQCGCI